MKSVTLTCLERESCAFINVPLADKYTKVNSLGYKSTFGRGTRVAANETINNHGAYSSHKASNLFGGTFVYCMSTHSCSYVSSIVSTNPKCWGFLSCYNSNITIPSLSVTSSLDCQDHIHVKMQL